MKRVALPKAPTGVAGLDEILHGGLPRERITLVTGGPGAGKTVLALQTLVNGARLYEEPGIFVAFEENSKQIVSNAGTFGWDLVGLQKKNLFFLDARMGPEFVKAGEFDLTGMIAVIEDKARAMGAKRIVFDAIDVLLTLLDDALAERTELFRLYNWLITSGLTAIVTAKANPAAAKPGLNFTDMQFMSDAVITLHHDLHNQVSVRNLWVMKYRGSSFAENEVSTTIGPGGFDVFSTAGSTSTARVSKRRVSSGVPRLDAMLGGGYFRGSTVLLTGSPGTSKSTLGAAFVEAACKRGERACYVSFDESAAELARNFSSVGIDFSTHVASGRLEVAALSAESMSSKEHYSHIRLILERHRPTCLVVDPLSALIKSGGGEMAESVAKRLMNLGKSLGVTVLSTSLLSNSGLENEATPLQISTIADTWIHLSYIVRDGERNRALTIVKSRGTRHSNQVRELLLSKQGITLADAYSAEGEVLMGTRRWQKENADRLNEARAQAESKRKRLNLELAQNDLLARLGALQRELDVNQADLESLRVAEARKVRRKASDSRLLSRLRSADLPTRTPDQM
jgi:circadian clock protein KaiC